MNIDRSLCIDMHCHILPGVDDGAKDSAMALRMAKIAWDEGIRAMIVTPHRKEGMHCVSMEGILRRIGELEEACEAQGFPMRFYPGAEHFYDHDLPERLLYGEEPTLNDTAYCLVEFHPTQDFPYIADALKAISYEGFLPVLAHIERYLCFTEDAQGLARAEAVKNSGAYIQVNAQSVLPHMFQIIPKFIGELLDAQMVDFVATDAHRDTVRAPKIKDVRDYLYRKYDEDYAADLLYRNAEKVIAAERI